MDSICCDLNYTGTLPQGFPVSLNSNKSLNFFMFVSVSCSWLLAFGLAPLARSTLLESLHNSIFWHHVVVCTILRHYYSVVWLLNVGRVFNNSQTDANKRLKELWWHSSNNRNRHEQSSPDHNRLNIAGHRVLDQNISKYLEFFWIAAIIINIHLHTASISVHSQVDKSIKMWKISLQGTFRLFSDQIRWSSENGCCIHLNEAVLFWLQQSELLRLPAHHSRLCYSAAANRVKGLSSSNQPAPVDWGEE